MQAKEPVAVNVMDQPVSITDESEVHLKEPPADMVKNAPIAVPEYPYDAVEGV